MRLRPWLTRAQVEAIHRGALGVLAELGVRVEHDGVATLLGAAGGRESSASGRVVFDAAEVERRVWDAPRTPLDEAGTPTLTLSAPLYQSALLHPRTGTLHPFDEESFARYVAHAQALPEVSRVSVLGLPFVPDGLRPALLPLAEKLYAWRHGITADGTVQSTDLCPALVELGSCRASQLGTGVADVLPLVGYMVSPLRLARPECEQLLYFRRQGLRMAIGHMLTQGLTAPVTLAGAVTLALAERMFLYLLEESLHGESWFTVGTGIATGDLRRATSCFGRPEAARASLAFADLARFYGCGCGGIGGLTDAKRPGFEAGLQKSSVALASALAVGHGSIEGGLLSMDEVCSPVQLVLDADSARWLGGLVREGASADAESLVLEVAEGLEGGGYVAAATTAALHRAELAGFRTLTSETLAGWSRGDRSHEVDRAREVALELWSRSLPAPRLTEAEEGELRAIITRAGTRLP